MSTILTLEQILAVVPQLDLVASMEEGFMAYSDGQVVVPPVGELIFDEPPGETHIKYGYIVGGSHYVVKIASGFYHNPSLGLSSTQGLMVLLDQHTGVVAAVLLDDGYLTNLRTAAAGAVAARHLAPTNVERIGILGAGTQARLQLEHVLPVVDCRKVSIWARQPERAAAYRQSCAAAGLEIETADSPARVAERCNLLITTTPSKSPLLTAEAIRPGTHITAMGSDTADKIELDPAVLARADVVVADSLAQSGSRGEVYRAVAAGRLDRGTVIELGNVIAGRQAGRTGDDQITVCDLTGVAVQDLMIAQAVYRAIQS